MFCSNFETGFVEFIFEQTMSLSKILKDYELFLISSNKEQVKGLIEKAKQNKFSIKIIDNLDGHTNFLTKYRILRNYIKTVDPHIIHVQNNWQLLLVVLIKYINFNHFKIIYSIHSFRNHKYSKINFFRFIIELSLLLFANLIIVHSEFSRQSFPLIRFKTKKIYLGVDPIFENKSDPHGKDFGEILIAIYPAKFRTGKNQFELISSIARYNSKSNNGKIKLFLPGDGPNLEKCINLVNSLRANDYIFFPGNLTKDSLYELYSNSHIAIIPSTSETYGFCIVEPITMGCVVITKPVGIAPELIINNYNGILFTKESELSSIFDELFNNKYLYNKLLENSITLSSTITWDSYSKYYNIAIKKL